MFQNSEIFPSEKNFWTKVIMVPDFNTLYIIYKFESFWPNFEIMASQQGARTSRLQENSFINEMQVWVLFDPIMG